LIAVSRSTPLFQSAAIIAADILPQPDGPDFNVYAPEKFEGTLYIGGWRRPADIGADKLYQTPVGVDAPRPLHWRNAPPSTLALNDPTVVRLTGDVLAMYVTVLDQVFATTADMCSHNVVGLAFSRDNGGTWDWNGIAIGQNNGLHLTGAWAPSALVQDASVTLWYHTGDRNLATGTRTSTQVLRSQLDNAGTLKSTALCMRTDTGVPLHAMNVSVTQLGDGTYWLVANDYSSADFYDLVAYTSRDGLAWTPWATTGPILVHAAGAMLLTPTILAVDASNLTLMYAEDLGGHTVEHIVRLGLNDPTQPHFLVQNVFAEKPAQSFAVTGDDYNGPVAGLEHEYIQVTPHNLSLMALSDNSFIRSADGSDALVAHGGYNVLDGGMGSNFLTGGTGRDTFFTHVDGGANTWSTVVGFRPGLDDLTLWDIAPDFRVTWTADQGAAGYQGATFSLPDGHGHFASLSLAGYTPAQADQLSYSVGMTGGHTYLHFG
jgi:hypothetical protein